MADIGTIIYCVDTTLMVKDALAGVPSKSLEAIPGSNTPSVLLRWTGVVAGQVEEVVLDTTPGAPLQAELVATFIEDCKKSAAPRRIIEVAPGVITTQGEADALVGLSAGAWRITGEANEWDLTLLEYLVVQVLVAGGGVVTAVDPTISALPWWPEA